jgi:glycosyltransferase involved in cell wall biosynthesis
MEHLKQQQTSHDLEWEVLLIDNASSDNTGTCATTYWKNGPAPMRVVLEPQLGEWNARLCGLKEARHDIIGFVDDDNWVAPNWVQRLSEIMTNDPTLGLCGSLLSPVFQVPPPAWFGRFQNYFAIVSAEYASRPHPAICAAGMGVRASAWRGLMERGFRGHMVGRVGRRLQSGCDSELCYALKLAGWRVAIDDTLRIEHYMPRARIDWTYLRRNVVGSAYGAPALDGYFFAWQKPNALRENWLWATASELKHLLQHSLAKVIRSRFCTMEGDDEVIVIDMVLARLFGILALRNRYTKYRREIRTAAWRDADARL